MIETFVDHGDRQQATPSTGHAQSPAMPLHGTGAVLPQPTGSKPRNFKTIPKDHNAGNSLVSFN